MERRDTGNLIDRCDGLAREIERLLETRAGADETRAGWESTLSSSALTLLRELREAGLDDRYVPAAGPRPDPHSAENWQAASEARDFLRTAVVDERGMAHLARYLRLAADRLRRDG